jgi:hypothetical protein
MKNQLPFILVLLLFTCKNDDDDVMIPECSLPTNIQASAIAHNSAHISWNDTNDTASFSIEYGISGFLLGTGTTVSSNTASLDLTGLQANSTYDVYLQSICTSSNISMQTQAYSFTTLPPLVVAQFLPKLSDLNLFVGDISDLEISPYAFKYDLVTPLFTDYAHKHRIIALPLGTSMQYIDNGFPDFPDGTLVAKTFYYNFDDRDESLGRTIIETRVLIKLNGVWELGNYHWNEEQTDAFIASNSVNVPISFINEDGDNLDINYSIPSADQCFVCHSNNGDKILIGPRLRTMNFNGQLENLIAQNYLSGISDASGIEQLPDWQDTSYSREERARAYFDVNCAHCHIEGGFCEDLSPLRLEYETLFEDTNIFVQRFSIIDRMQTYLPGYSMPYIGTTIIHNEGFELIESYINSL